MGAASSASSVDSSAALGALSSPSSTCLRSHRRAYSVHRLQPIELTVAHSLLQGAEARSLRVQLPQPAQLSPLQRWEPCPPPPPPAFDPIADHTLCTGSSPSSSQSLTVSFKEQQQALSPAPTPAPPLAPAPEPTLPSLVVAPDVSE
ncbi:UNVERIFIED_CONTAM: hypothetical protein FKN15_060294 [Acipenser sinensis]